MLFDLLQSLLQKVLLYELLKSLAFLVLDLETDVGHDEQHIHLQDADGL